MVKCMFSNDLNAVRNYDVGKITAFLESSSFNFGDAIRDFDGTQRGAVRKCAAADGSNGVGDCDILKQYTFFENGTAKSFYIAREFDALQFGTVEEHFGWQLADAILEDNGCKIRTGAENTRAKYCFALNRDTGERSNFSKGTSADIGDRCRESQSIQIRFSKSTAVNVF